MSHEHIVLYPSDYLSYRDDDGNKVVYFTVPEGSPPVVFTLDQIEAMVEAVRRRSPSVTR